MAFSTEEIYVAPGGHIYLGDFGVALPSTLADLTAPDYRELGYLSEDGASITPAIDTNGIKVWQSVVDAKTVLTGVAVDVKISMMQINQDTTAEYFFGQEWINSGGLGKLILSDNPPIAYRTMVVDWEDDGGYDNRLVLARGTLTDRDALQLQRSDAAALGVTFHCLSASGQLGYILSNNPDLVPAT